MKRRVRFFDESLMIFSARRIYQRNERSHIQDEYCNIFSPAIATEKKRNFYVILFSTHVLKFSMNGINFVTCSLLSQHYAM